MIGGCSSVGHSAQSSPYVGSGSTTERRDPFTFSIGWGVSLIRNALAVLAHKKW